MSASTTDVGAGLDIGDVMWYAGNYRQDSQ